MGNSPSQLPLHELTTASTDLFTASLELAKSYQAALEAQQKQVDELKQNIKQLAKQQIELAQIAEQESKSMELMENQFQLVNHKFNQLSSTAHLEIQRVSVIQAAVNNHSQRLETAENKITERTTNLLTVVQSTRGCIEAMEGRFQQVDKELDLVYSIIMQTETSTDDYINNTLEEPIAKRTRRSTHSSQ